MASGPSSISNDPHAAATAPTLGSLARRASLWTILGHAAQMALRLGTNVVLASLLFPEAFGLMALVLVFTQGLELFSNVGLNANVVQNRRGDEPRFLHTVWTIQVARGWLLWLGACALAWPAGLIYDTRLIELLPIASLSLVLQGFKSTAISTAERHLRLGRVMGLELGAQLTGAVVMIAWALHMPTVWALVGGTLAAAAAKMIGSHYLGGRSPRFAWDSSAAREVLHFGKWIFLATAMTFVANQGDKLILGQFLTMAELGVYAIAITLARAVKMTVSTLCQKVFFPAFSRVVREQPRRLAEVYYKARWRQDALVLPVIGFLLVTGPLLIDLLYDARYADAGWMLQVLILPSIVTPGVLLGQMALMAKGLPKYSAQAQTSRAVLLVISVPLLYHAFGITGAVWAVGLNAFGGIWITLAAMRRQNILHWRHEWSLAFLAPGLLIGLLLRLWMG